jgi:hypothetical protein
MSFEIHLRQFNRCTKDCRYDRLLMNRMLGGYYHHREPVDLVAGTTAYRRCRHSWATAFGYLVRYLRSLIPL